MKYRESLKVSEFEVVYTEYARRYPNKFKYELAGRSLEELPIWRCTITDSEISDENKESVLLLSTHGGQEISGVNTLLKTIKWLLSDDPQAVSIRQNQVVTFVPCVNPEGYDAIKHGNSAGCDPYQEYTLSALTNADKCPEAKIISEILDEIKPEILLDVHGLPGGADYWMLENTGDAYSFSFCRPFHRDITREMDKAAEQLGFPQHRAEQDNELYPSTSITEFNRHFMGRGPLVNFATYAYNKYHTLAMACEVCWEDSGLARIKQMLNYGNKAYQTEFYPGYPSRIVRSSCTHQVSAYGTTASDRRQSRCELWGMADDLSISFIAPQKIGIQTMAIGIGPGANTFSKLAMAPSELLEQLQGNDKYDTAGLKSVFAKTDKGTFITQPETPEDDAACRKSSWVNLAERDLHNFKPVQHGLSARMWLPFQDAQIDQITFNGRIMPVSEEFGYTTWQERCYTFIQLNIAPEQVAEINIFSVEYSTKTERKVGVSLSEMLEA